MTIARAVPYEPDLESDLVAAYPLLVRRLTIVLRDPDAAQDVAQAVFLKVWQGLGRYDPARRFDTWLYRVTVNAAIDALRSRGPRAVLQSLAAAEEPADTAPGAGPEQRIDADRLQRAFLRLAARLAPRQRAAFVLREIEGLGTEEIAAILEVTESTVRNHLLQARRTLRAGLEREYPDLVPRVRDDSEESA